jgi:hypothetical protein
MDHALVANVLATNPGRVAEACTAIKVAAENPMKVREMFEAYRQQEVRNGSDASEGSEGGGQRQGDRQGRLSSAQHGD